MFGFKKRSLLHGKTEKKILETFSRGWKLLVQHQFINIWNVLGTLMAASINYYDVTSMIFLPKKIFDILLV